MRILIVASVYVILACLHTSYAFAQESVVLYDGFGAELIRIDNPVKQTTTCLLRARTGAGVFSIAGPDSLLFSIEGVIDSRGENIARGSSGGIINLVRAQAPGVLVFPPGLDTEAYIRDMVNGRQFTLQFVLFPSAATSAKSTSEIGLNVAYQQGVEKCGWANIVEDERRGFPPVTLREMTIGATGIYARVEGVRFYSETKYFEIQKDTGILDRCIIEANHGSRGRRELLGLRSKKFGVIGGYANKKSISITDPVGNVLFQDDVEGDGERPVKWNRVAEFLAAVRAAGPEGYLIDGDIGSYSGPNKIQLYGLPELYEWGVKNCGYPAL